MYAPEKKTGKGTIALIIITALIAIAALIFALLGLFKSKDTQDNAIPTISEQVDNIKDSIPGLENVNTELDGYIKTLEESVTKLQAQLDETNKRIEAVQTEAFGKADSAKTEALNQLTSDKAELEEQLRELETQIDDTNKDFENSESIINAKLSALAEEMKKADSDNKSAIEAQLSALRTLLEEADSNTKSEIEAQIKKLEEELKNADAENAKTAEDMVNELNTELSALISENETAIAQLENKATELETKISDTITEIAKTKAELKTMITESEEELIEKLESLKSETEADLAVIIADLATLASNDQILSQNIINLKEYVDTSLKGNKDWANATFSTLEQYEATQTTISEIKALIATINTDIDTIEKDVAEKVDAINKSIADLDAELTKKVTEITNGYTSAIADATDAITAAYTNAIKTAITASETSMKAWVNSALADGYYTKAEFDGKIAALQTQVAEGDAALQKEIDDLETALEKAEADLTAAYKKAIEDAINENNGIITSQIAEAVKTAEDNLQAQIDAINSDIEDIENRLTTLEENFENRIQSITFIPGSYDGKVMMDFTAKAVTLDFRISPASLAEAITAGNVKAYAHYTGDPVERGWATDAIPLTVSSVTGNENGMLKVLIEESSDNHLSTDFWLGDVEAVIYIVIIDHNGNDVVSDAIPMIAHNYAGNTNTINGFADGGSQTGEVSE